MTQEDPDQIRAMMREEVRTIVRKEVRGIVREEIAANNETLSATLRTEFDDRLTAAVVAIRQDFAEQIGAAAVSFVTSLSELRKELGTRIDALDRRMVALEHRMDGIAETTGAIATEVAALTRWANRLDRENLETLNTQAAQQQAIDDLAKRLRPPNQPPS
jgi:septal ring factor EnvC (AmiA/AmiB activator)